jgi:heme oxygenase
MVQMISDTISRLGRLRAGTREAHASIEAVPALARLVAPDLTRDEYVAILRHMHAFLAHIEPAIVTVLETLPDAAALLDGTRPRALAADLAWFGVAAIAAPPLPALDDPAAALGALYVIVGSGLGGRVIARHLADSLGVAAGSGASFYDGLTAEAARRQWYCLTALLDRADLLEQLFVAPGAVNPGRDAVGRDAEERIVAGAQTTFHALSCWMRRIAVVQPSGHVAAEGVAS